MHSLDDVKELGSIISRVYAILGGHPLRHTLLIFKALLAVSDSSMQMRMQGQRRHWVSCMKKPRTLLLTGARKSL